MPLSDGRLGRKLWGWLSAVGFSACVALAVIAEDPGLVVLGIVGAGFFAVTVLLVYYGDPSPAHEDTRGRKRVQFALRVAVALLVTSILLYHVGEPSTAVEKVGTAMFWASLAMFGMTIIARIWGPWKDPE
jgi:hypothetical protein